MSFKLLSTFFYFLPHPPPQNNTTGRALSEWDLRGFWQIRVRVSGSCLTLCQHLSSSDEYSVPRVAARRRRRRRRR